MKLTDTGVRCLVDLPALAHLNLEGQLKMTDRGVEMMAGCTAECGACPALTSLTLSWNTTLTNASMWALRHLTSLTALDVLFCKNLDDVGMLSLSSLPALTSLNISFTTVTDEGLRALALLPKLTSLCIEECAVTDMGVAALPPRVQVLSYLPW